MLYIIMYVFVVGSLTLVAENLCLYDNVCILYINTFTGICGLAK